MKNMLFSLLLLLFMKAVFGDADDVSVMQADSVTLQTGLTEIQRDDVIDWRFGPESDLIARINRPANKTTISDGPDGRFRDRLQLDHQTGSLTITNTTTTDSGDYKVSSGSVRRAFSVTVEPAHAVGSIIVTEGDSVTLHTHVTKIQRDSVIQWRLQNSLVAEINREAGIFYTSDGPDGRFRHRLQINCLTGSLTIENIGTTDSGLYEVGISSSKHAIYKTFTLTVSDALEPESVKVGNPVTLNSNLTKIQINDVILWIFGDTVIARITQAAQLVYGDDERFKDRLKVNHRTGSLTITNTRTTDDGPYKLQISSSRYTINKRFTVIVTEPYLSAPAITLIVCGGVVLLAAAVVGVFYFYCKISQPKEQKKKMLPVIEGETVPLIPSDTKISEKDDIQWRFNGTVIAGDGKFQLNKCTGSLIITKIKAEDTGLYELQINSLGCFETLEIFSVTVYAKTNEIQKVKVKEGESVTLETDVPEIQRGHEILWKFGLNTPIAAIQGGRKKIPPFAAGWRFIFRLNLNETGSLTIKNVRPMDTGFYVLRVIKSKNTSLKLFRVKISASNPEEMPLV